MHRILQAALANGARGESRHVVVAVADIRGFSKFSHSHDSADVATYVSKLYLRLIELFGGISEEFFFKPTGDGLLMVFPFEESELKRTFSAVVARAVSCHAGLSKLLKDVPVINFPVPNEIGFGVTRGSACAILSGRASKTIVLDYSGHKLNLAARLQDLARPSGVVIEGSPDIHMLPKRLRERLRSKAVYIRSVAESSPATIWALDSVRISPSALVPIGARKYEKKHKFTKKELLALPAGMHFSLKEGVIVEGTLLVRLRRDSNPKHEPKGIWMWNDALPPADYTVRTDASKPVIVLKSKELIKASSALIDKAAAGAVFEILIQCQLL
jgi:class 3 adenylate cyclase